MNKNEARKLLASQDPDERLVGARHLEKRASAADERVIRRCLRREDVSWIKNALRRALMRATGELKERPYAASVDSSDQGWHDEVYAKAIEETTRLILHSIEPVVGMLRLHGKKEVPGFDNSQVFRQIERLDDLLAAIGTLSRAAGAPKREEFDLHELITSVCEGEKRNGMQVHLAGHRPMVIAGDHALVRIALENGLRNAIESSLDARADNSEVQPVTISWGDTDKDVWISIVDHGTGPPPGIDRVWDIGSTTKRGHLGMGLALAQRSLRSLGGSISLRPREDGGAVFEVRWPLPQTERI